MVRSGYTVGVPFAGYWREILNSDATVYGGHGEGNEGGRESEPVPWDGHQHSLKLTLPPNSTLVLKYAG